MELGAVAGEKRRGINKFGPLALLEAVKCVFDCPHLRPPLPLSRICQSIDKIPLCGSCSITFC